MMINNLLSKPSKPYSPLRYPGGKARLARFLSEMIRQNNIYNCTFIEPYAGGAGAAITLLFMEEVESIVINDLDRAIFAFWNSILYKNDEFIERLEEIEISIDEWRIQKENYKNPNSSEFDLGFASFYLNRTNRSGIIEGGPIGGNSQNGKWKIDARFNKKTLIERIRKISYYKNRIKLFNLDGLDLIKKYYKSDNTFFYLDPPYFIKGSSLYLNHYRYDNHRYLSFFLNGNPRFTWLLTYDNTPEISQLYTNRNKFEFTLNYHASLPKEGKELLILSDRLSMN